VLVRASHWSTARSSKKAAMPRKENAAPYMGNYRMTHLAFWPLGLRMARNVAVFARTRNYHCFVGSACDCCSRRYAVRGCRTQRARLSNLCCAHKRTLISIAFLMMLALRWSSGNISISRLLAWMADACELKVSKQA